MSIGRKWYRRAIVRAIELVLIGFKYMFFSACMIGALVLFCLFASALLKAFGVG